MFFVSTIKNWVKLLVLRAWTIFITLLASDPDSVPRIQDVERGSKENSSDNVAKKSVTSKKKKTVKKKKVEKTQDENEKDIETELKDVYTTKVSAAEGEGIPRELGKIPDEEEEGSSKSAVDEGSREYADPERLKRKTIISSELVRRGYQAERKDEDYEAESDTDIHDYRVNMGEDDDDDDDVPWLGVGRGTGLTRYSGVQNLVDSDNLLEEPLSTERRSPVLLPRREGPLIMPRTSLIKSFSQEKDRLAEIPEDAQPSSKTDSDALWASLVARYGSAEKEANEVDSKSEEDNKEVFIKPEDEEKNFSKPEDEKEVFSKPEGDDAKDFDEPEGEGDVFIKGDEENFYAQGTQQQIFTSPKSSITSKEFSDQVGERLQMYLARIEDKEEEEIQNDETRELDEAFAATMGITENDNQNKIFIMIEDEDSNEDKEDSYGIKDNKEYTEAIIADDERWEESKTEDIPCTDVSEGFIKEFSEHQFPLTEKEINLDDGNELLMPKILANETLHGAACVSNDETTGTLEYIEETDMTTGEEDFENAVTGLVSIKMKIHASDAESPFTGSNLITITTEPIPLPTPPAKPEPQSPCEMSATDLHTTTDTDKTSEEAAETGFTEPLPLDSPVKPALSDDETVSKISELVLSDDEPVSKLTEPGKTPAEIVSSALELLTTDIVSLPAAVVSVISDSDFLPFKADHSHNQEEVSANVEPFITDTEITCSKVLPETDEMQISINEHVSEPVKVDTMPNEGECLSTAVELSAAEAELITLPKMKSDIDGHEALAHEEAKLFMEDVHKEDTLKDSVETTVVTVKLPKKKKVKSDEKDVALMETKLCQTDKVYPAKSENITEVPIEPEEEESITNILHITETQVSRNDVHPDENKKVTYPENFYEGRRQSRDQWMLECEKVLEDQSSTASGHRKDDVFSTTYEEFPEDYMTSERAELPQQVDKLDSTVKVEQSATTDLEKPLKTVVDDTETGISEQRCTEEQPYNIAINSKDIETVEKIMVMESENQQSMTEQTKAIKMDIITDESAKEIEEKKVEHLLESLETKNNDMAGNLSSATNEPVANVTVCLKKKKKPETVKEVESDEPVKVAKSSVKKGKLDFIMKRFEAKGKADILPQKQKKEISDATRNDESKQQKKETAQVEEDITTESCQEIHEVVPLHDDSAKGSDTGEQFVKELAVFEAGPEGDELTSIPERMEDINAVEDTGALSVAETSDRINEAAEMLETIELDKSKSTPTTGEDVTMLEAASEHELSVAVEKLRTENKLSEKVEESVEVSPKKIKDGEPSVTEIDQVSKVAVLESKEKTVEEQVKEKVTLDTKEDIDRLHFDTVITTVETEAFDEPKSSEKTLSLRLDEETLETYEKDKVISDIITSEKLKETENKLEVYEYIKEDKISEIISCDADLEIISAVASSENFEATANKRFEAKGKTDILPQKQKKEISDATRNDKSKQQKEETAQVEEDITTESCQEIHEVVPLHDDSAKGRDTGEQFVKELRAFEAGPEGDELTSIPERMEDIIAVEDTGAFSVAETSDRINEAAEMLETIELDKSKSTPTTGENAAMLEAASEHELSVAVGKLCTENKLSEKVEESVEVSPKKIKDGEPSVTEIDQVSKVAVLESKEKTVEEQVKEKVTLDTKEDIDRLHFDTVITTVETEAFDEPKSSEKTLSLRLDEETLETYEKDKVISDIITSEKLKETENKLEVYEYIKEDKISEIISCDVDLEIFSAVASSENFEATANSIVCEEQKKSEEILENIVSSDNLEFVAEKIKNEGSLAAEVMKEDKVMDIREEGKKRSLLNNHEDREPMESKRRQVVMETYEQLKMEEDILEPAIEAEKIKILAVQLKSRKSDADESKSESQVMKDDRLPDAAAPEVKIISDKMETELMKTDDVATFVEPKTEEVVTTTGEEEVLGEFVDESEYAETAEAQNRQKHGENIEQLQKGESILTTLADLVNVESDVDKSHCVESDKVESKTVVCETADQLTTEFSKAETVAELAQEQLILETKVAEMKEIERINEVGDVTEQREKELDEKAIETFKTEERFEAFPFKIEDSVVPEVENRVTVCDTLVHTQKDDSVLKAMTMGEVISEKTDIQLEEIYSRLEDDHGTAELSQESSKPLATAIDNEMDLKVSFIVPAEVLVTCEVNKTTEQLQKSDEIIETVEESEEISIIADKPETVILEKRRSYQEVTELSDRGKKVDDNFETDNDKENIKVQGAILEESPIRINTDEVRQLGNKDAEKVIESLVRKESSPHLKSEAVTIDSVAVKKKVKLETVSGDTSLETAPKKTLKLGAKKGKLGDVLKRYEPKEEPVVPFKQRTLSAGSKRFGVVKDLTAAGEDDKKVNKAEESKMATEDKQERAGNISQVSEICGHVEDTKTNGSEPSAPAAEETVPVGQPRITEDEETSEMQKDKIKSGIKRGKLDDVLKRFETKEKVPVVPFRQKKISYETKVKTDKKEEKKEPGVTDTVSKISETDGKIQNENKQEKLGIDGQLSKQEETYEVKSDIKESNASDKTGETLADVKESLLPTATDESLLVSASATLKTKAPEHLEISEETSSEAPKKKIKIAPKKGKLDDVLKKFEAKENEPVVRKILPKSSASKKIGIQSKIEKQDNAFEKKGDKRTGEIEKAQSVAADVKMKDTSKIKDVEVLEPRVTKHDVAKIETVDNSVELFTEEKPTSRYDDGGSMSDKNVLCDAGSETSGFGFEEGKDDQIKPATLPDKEKNSALWSVDDDQLSKEKQSSTSVEKEGPTIFSTESKPLGKDISARPEKEEPSALWSEEESKPPCEDLAVIPKEAETSTLWLQQESKLPGRDISAMPKKEDTSFWFEEESKPPDKDKSTLSGKKDTSTYLPRKESKPPDKDKSTLSGKKDTSTYLPRKESKPPGKDKSTLSEKEKDTSTFCFEEESKPSALPEKVERSPFLFGEEYKPSVRDIAALPKKEESMPLLEEESKPPARGKSSAICGKEETPTFWFEESTLPTPPLHSLQENKEKKPEPSAVSVKIKKLNLPEEQKTAVHNKKDTRVEELKNKLPETYEKKGKRKESSYLREKETELYYTKRETEKPFSVEKNEELARLRKETIEAPRYKKLKKELEREMDSPGTDTFTKAKDKVSLEESTSVLTDEKVGKGSSLQTFMKNINSSNLVSAAPEKELSDNLEDVKDLLVPVARRTKTRRQKVLDDIMKLNETDDLTSLTSKMDTDEISNEPAFLRDTVIAGDDATLDTKSSTASEEQTGITERERPNKFLTEEEQMEYAEIRKEQEVIRAAQMKELEKYLSMPDALTEQEQLELEELLVEEETDRAAIATSEARLEAILAEVRKRFGDVELDAQQEDLLEKYLGFPVGLTEEEERLLSSGREEKDRSEFATEDEYREYIKQKYLEELEEERLRVEEEEYEFGQYYEDDEYEEDYDYEDEEDYGPMEEEDKHLPHTLIMRDEAVGSDEPMEFYNDGEDKSRKTKSFFPALPSLRSKGSKGSKGNLDRQGSRDSSNEGSTTDLPNDQKNTQTKKFFRYGSLSVKRKKKSNEYPQLDPEKVNSHRNTAEAVDAPADVNPRKIHENADIISGYNNNTASPRAGKINHNLNHNKAKNIHVQAGPPNSSSVIEGINNNMSEENSSQLTSTKDLADGLGENTLLTNMTSCLSYEVKNNLKGKTSDPVVASLSKPEFDATADNDANNKLDAELLQEWEIVDHDSAEILSQNTSKVSPSLGSSYHNSFKHSPDSTADNNHNIMARIISLLRQKNGTTINQFPNNKPFEHLKEPAGGSRAEVLDCVGTSQSELKKQDAIDTKKDNCFETLPLIEDHFSMPEKPKCAKRSPAGSLSDNTLRGVTKPKATTMSGVGRSRVRAPAKEAKDVKMAEAQLWPEEEHKEEMDEFKKMEQEVLEEMEAENEKNMRDADKKGKKKKKRKGESEKENKEPVGCTLSLSSYLSSGDESVDNGPPAINGHLYLNGHISPSEADYQKNHVELEPVADEEDLPSINVKMLAASYLSVAEQSANKKTNSPSSTPVRSRTPISQLAETYLTPSASRSSSADEASHSLYPSDFIPSVTLKSLKSAYEESMKNCPVASQSFTAREDVNISFLQMRDAYCSVASGSPREGNSPTPQPIIPLRSEHDKAPAINFRSLTRSCGDLTKGGRSEYRTPPPLPNLETQNVGHLLHVSVKALCANFSGAELEQIARAGRPRRPILTGVSVRNMKTTYQNRDNLLEKHVGPRIRSFDAAKMKTKFNKPKEPTQVSNDCRICGKPVFQMEKIVAEKASWHKNCFRCSVCDKNLTLETYQSHEGSLYCKPHFKELFRPKVVIQDEAEERKERLLRRPRLIVLESQPVALPDDIVRATQKPDYGLEELQTLNVKQRFAMFENFSKEEEQPKLEPVSVRRSQSLISKAAKFLEGEDGEKSDEEDEEENENEDEEENEEEGEEEEETSCVKSRKKKERPMSFSGMGDLKAAWEQKQRREEMSQARKEDLSKFRQMLCAGKNIALKEMFESGNFENADEEKQREEIKIEGRRAASNLRARFEKGQPFILEDEEGSEEGSKKELEGERREVEEVFKDAETAKKARNVFKQIDSQVSQEGNVVLRSPSFAAQNRENRYSLDLSTLMMPQRSASSAEVVKASEKMEEVMQVDTTDLASRFKFFSTYEQRLKEEEKKKKKVFRITPPRDGIDQGLDHGSDDREMLGRDPNLIKCTDNYQDEIDCRNTKNILQMFKKMEMGEEEEEEESEGPRPLKRFTPPPNGEGEYEDSEEYSEEYYSDEDDEEESEGEPVHYSESSKQAAFKDELLQMGTCPQGARKAANLRAKFERWEEKQNELNKDKDGEVEEECRPSIDTARNLKAMFENKAIEVSKPVTSKPVQKVNRFVVGGGEKCVCCEKTVYAMEKLEIYGRVLHKSCFKCYKCNTNLSIGSFAFGGEHVFCTNHYKQLFTEKGSYDAFMATKWTSKIEEANIEGIKSHD